MTKQTILFVDDDEKILRSWRRSFDKQSYQMLFAKNATEALNILEQTEVSLVVTDYCMPKMSGLELLGQIQERFPDIVKILVSGHATLKVAQEAINTFGVYKLFEKPCNPIELGLAIHDGLQGCRQKVSPDTDLLLLEKKYPGITQVKRGPGGVINL